MRRRAILAALAGMATAGCRSTPQPGVKIDPALAMMTPETAVALAGVKMDAIRKTDVYRRHSEALGLDQFSKDTGLDTRTDVWELLVVFEPSGWVAMARGKFSPGFGGLEPRMLEGAPRTFYKGYTIIGNQQASTVFVNSSTALAGAGAAVRSLLDRRSASRGIPPALEEQIRNIPPGAGIWIASGARLGGLPIALEGNWANLNRIIESIQAGWLGVDLSNGVEVSARGSCATEQDARGLHDAMRGLIGLGRLTTPASQSELLRLYDSIQVGRREREVTLSAVVPLELVDRGIGYIRPLMIR
ncbi:MAG: hypothetical protein Q8N47_18305 [Bryobacterales bacterium]|nr:hypothetical protein [Bryobacterales bacterium]